MVMKEGQVVTGCLLTFRQEFFKPDFVSQLAMYQHEISWRKQIVIELEKDSQKMTAKTIFS